MSVKIFEDKIIFEGMVDGIRALKDKTLAITIHTQEMDAIGGGAIFAFNQRFSNIMLTPGEIKKSDIDDLRDYKGEGPKVKEEKSPAKRMKNELFFKWKILQEKGRLSKEHKDNFDAFYQNRINEYISHERKLSNQIKDSNL